MVLISDTSCSREEAWRETKITVSCKNDILEEPSLRLMTPCQFIESHVNVHFKWSMKMENYIACLSLLVLYVDHGIEWPWHLLSSTFSLLRNTRPS